MVSFSSFQLSTLSIYWAAREASSSSLPMDRNSSAPEKEINHFIRWNENVAPVGKERKKERKKERVLVGDEGSKKKKE